MKRFSKIALPEAHVPVQASFLEAQTPHSVRASFLEAQTPHSVRELYAPFPHVYRSRDDLERVLADVDATSPGLIGLDMEYDSRTMRPSILGLSGLNRALSVPWDYDICPGVVKRLAERYRLVAYSTFSADKACLDPHVPTRREGWLDAMVSHYLAHQDLCKRPSKDEDDDAGALGFMNLWTALSLVADTPCYKNCRGVDCYGPCPTHKVFEYNGVDAWAGLKIHIENSRELDRMGVPAGFREEMLELSALCEEMRARGVTVDAKVVAALDKEFREKKAALFRENEPFNPKSPKAVVAWFKTAAKEAKLPELAIARNDKECVQDAIMALGKRYDLDEDKPDAVAAALRDFAGVPDLVRPLCDLHDYKSGGKGVKAWFDSRYFDKEGMLHPRTIGTGTSTGRLSCSSPNLQNVPKIGWGKKVRAAIIPREGFQFIRADFKQLELRMCLYLAGVDPKDIGKDAFTWLVGQSNGAFSRAAAMTGKTERDVAKRVSHASDYGEGITVLSSDDLSSPRVKAAIGAGALKVYTDWEYAGGLVAFTGANLAEALFGAKSWPSRKKALEIQEDIYFANFPQIRAWQRRVLAEVEARGYVKYPTGRFLRLSGANWDEESRPFAMTEDAKIAFAALGSGVSADHVQAVMLRYRRETAAVPTLQIHDELLFEVPLDWTDAQCAKFIRMMTEETWRLPGFSAPVDAGVGSSWLAAMEAADKHPLEI